MLSQNRKVKKLRQEHSSVWIHCKCCACKCSMCTPAVVRYTSKRCWIASQVRCHTAASNQVVASQIRLVALLTAVELVVCRRNVWRNPRMRSRLGTGPEILVATVSVSRAQSNFRAAALTETLTSKWWKGDQEVKFHVLPGNLTYMYQVI
jgi:hypothetical protein